MIQRRWISVARDAPISCAAPYKEVQPEMLLYEGAKAPEAVEVRRTYETVFERLLRTISASATRHVIDLRKVDGDGRIARYEAWQAAHYEPLLRPTPLYYRDLGGKRRDRSTVLLVTPSTENAWRRPATPLKIGASFGPGSAGIEYPLTAEKTLKGSIDAPVDPEVEIFVLSPQESAGSLSFEQYIDSYLASLEADLGRDPDFEGEPDRLRSLFEQVYGRFLSGTGRIEAEVVNPERIVRPGEPEKVEVRLHTEGEGATMMMLGTRILGEEEGAISVSEMLPLSWKAEGSEDLEEEREEDLAPFKVIRKFPKKRPVKISGIPAPKEREAGA